ncbi:hypothetical protein Bbelb_229960 [Branchiostoma belcheri]|nr:hypothetical protein Bbelb_229960 [Branchiostoma belcheri]
MTNAGSYWRRARIGHEEKNLLIFGRTKLGHKINCGLAAGIGDERAESGNRWQFSAAAAVRSAGYIRENDSHPRDLTLCCGVRQPLSRGYRLMRLRFAIKSYISLIGPR